MQPKQPRIPPTDAKTERAAMQAVAIGAALHEAADKEHARTLLAGVLTPDEVRDFDLDSIWEHHLEREAVYARFPDRFRLAAEAQHDVADLVAWRSDTRNVRALLDVVGRSNPVLTDDLVIGAAATGRIRAVNRASGDWRWTRNLPKYVHRVWVSGNFVIAAHTNGIAALLLENGRELWRHVTAKGNWIGSPPTGNDDLIVFGDNKGILTAIDANGQFVWSTTTMLDLFHVYWSSIYIQGDRILVAHNRSYLFCFELTTGSEIWRAPLDGPCTTRLIPWKECVLAGSPHAVQAIRIADGRESHRWVWPDYESWSFDTTDDTLIVVMRRENGPDKPMPMTSDLVGFRGDHEVYRVEYPPYISPQLGLDRGTRLLYEASMNGIGIVEPNSGRRLACVTGFHRVWMGLRENRTTVPTVADGMMYVVSERGSILALRHP